MKARHEFPGGVLRLLRLFCVLAAIAAPLPVLASAPPPSRPAVMLARAMDGVVQIEASGAEGADPFAGASLRSAGAAARGGEPSGGPRGSAGGAGFVFAPGLIATNAHVLGGAGSARVRLHDGRMETAVLVGADPVLDLAVLRLPGASPAPIAWGASVRLGEGDAVWAVGAPMGYGFSVTAGVVSGRGRFYDDAFPVALLQHDAALNPGNSGGPLLDAAGRVVGINTATPPGTIFDIGVGLAIPAETARAALARLARDGRIERGVLGLTAAPADADVAQALGAGAPGLLVDAVAGGGAADAAGLRPGDLLARVDGAGVATPRDLTRALLDAAPGQAVRLDYYRGGALRTAQAVLAAPPAAPVAVAESDRALEPGLSLGRDPTGVVVLSVHPYSPAERYGLRRGDRIVAVNGRAVADEAEAQTLIASGARVAVLRIARAGEAERHVILPLTREAAAARPVGRVAALAAGPA